MERSIATRTGDDGTTSLVFGTRVSKDDIRVECYGTIDELNAVLGVARAHCQFDYIKNLITSLQNETFITGGELATPPEKLDKLKRRVDKAMVEELDKHVKVIETQHTFTSDWAMPGDHPSAASLDFARTVCRRAERYVIRLYKVVPESKNPELVRYLNRLSDLLWLMARWQEKDHNAKLTSVREFLNSK
jgi:cob(I)alamin adenosyltransferase